MSTGRFWFLSTVVDSVLCRHQGTVLHKHVPLVESCTLTNPNTVADGRVSYGTTSTKEKWEVSQTIASDTWNRPQGWLRWRGQGSLHLAPPLFREWLSSLFTQHGRSSSWSLWLPEPPAHQSESLREAFGESRNEVLDSTLREPTGPSRLESAGRAQESPGQV